uniref:Uncharacterized protein n=1 Tax=Schistocephalus solidus TaxID=70667 RepID=A0A0X3P6Q9_SCHSO
MRNTIKLAGPQLQTLVINSFQFLLTFAAHILFASTAEPFPAVSGLQKPLPCLLQQEPRRYLRLYLDMACALLKWPVVESFQGQSHEDLMESLLECIRVYENADLEGRENQHQKSRKRYQRGATAAASSSLKPIPVSPYAAANEAACIFWSLLIEVGLKYAQSCDNNLLPLSPSNILPVGMKTQADLTVDNDCLLFLHKLFSLQQVFEGHSDIERKKRRGSVGGGHKSSGSILQVMHASLRPQDLAVFYVGASSLPKFMFESCLLERFIRLHLSLAGLFDSLTGDQCFRWADEVVGVATVLSKATDGTQSIFSLLVLPYPRADLLRLHCLIKALRARYTQSQNRIAEQVACFQRLLSLLEVLPPSVGNTATSASPESLTKIDNCEGLVHLQLSSNLQLLQILEVILKLWLYSKLRETRQLSEKQSVDIALLIMILHQNTAWSKLLMKINSDMLQDFMKVIKEDWVTIRLRILAWIKSGFIVDVSLLTHLVHIESEASSSTCDMEESELVRACISRIENPSSEPTVLLLAEFIKAEAANIRACLCSQ